MKTIKLKNKRVMIRRNANNDIDVNFVRLKDINEEDDNCSHRKVVG